MLLRFFYNISLFLALFLMLPRLFQKKARSSLKERLGLKAPELRSDKPERIWVHAVSVGEAKAVIPLVKRLRDEKPEAFIVFTTTTKTGLNEVEKGCLEADRAFLMPLDFFTAKLVQEMRPTLV
ncbi:MAG: 3-deoxy-D-manno-octulosonic acid transferase, partial [Chlamydiia bacterium]|nr:3-deoxy-D-manno-octulosonic acid transferase [Chlamydiia bacterium]